ncbi:MAG: hypothetical protein GX325_02900 [Peptococcaceae bacterium]|nr:hypothetical protein [Peptococcaceae bacterium]
MTKRKNEAGIKPEVLAAISAALALYGCSVEAGYQVSSITKAGNAWKRAGIAELMLGRDLTMRDFM